MYWDDGETFDYQKSQYYRQEFTCSIANSKLTVNLGAVEGSYEPWWKTIRIVAYGGRAAKSVTVNGASAKNEFAGGRDWFEVPASRAATRIEISY